MQGSPKNSINKHVASSEGQGVVQYLPKENTVVLKNGRKIQYDQLVIATGLKAECSAKGFNEAWADLDTHVYADQDHESWKLSASKSFRYIHNFPGGNALYYIPPAPFHGEIEHYNFFLAKELWDRYDQTGLISWKNSNYTIINANNSFCSHFDQADGFIKSELEKRNINVEYGLKLVEVRKETSTAVFENIQTGERSERPYGNLYSLLEKKADPILADAGLATNNGLLDVNPTTLQHNKYSNIYGLGDVANVPTTKTFFAGFNQLHVVRHNLEQVINGAEPNAHYDGASEAVLHLGLESSTTVSHLYDGKASGSLDSGFMAGLKYKLADKGKKSIIDLMKFKSWGPPYYKWKKTFDGSKISTSSAPQNMQPEQKTA